MLPSARPHRDLRRAGPRRHAVHPSGQRARQHGHRHGSRRLFGRAADAHRTDYPTWNFPAEPVSYPIGASAADANYARARVQLNQSTAQLRALELQVATEVTNAALQVENGLTRHEAAAAARAARRKRGSRRNRAGSTSASRPTSSSSRRSATWRPRRTPNCARCSTTGARSSTSSACRKRRPARWRVRRSTRRRRVGGTAAGRWRLDAAVREATSLRRRYTMSGPPHVAIAAGGGGN